MVFVTWSRWLPCPLTCTTKTLENLLVRNKMSHDFKTRHIWDSMPRKLFIKLMMTLGLLWYALRQGQTLLKVLIVLVPAPDVRWALVGPLVLWLSNILQFVSLYLRRSRRVCGYQAKAKQYAIRKTIPKIYKKVNLFKNSSSLVAQNKEKRL